MARGAWSAWIDREGGPWHRDRPEGRSGSMRSMSKRLAITAILAIGVLGVPTGALAYGTCPGEAIETAAQGKLAKIDLNGDGIVCAMPQRVIGKHAGKPLYIDNS